MDPLDEIKAAIVGHSYVSWLQNFIINDKQDELGKINLDLGIYKETLEVKYYAKPGGPLDRIRKFIQLNSTVYINLFETPHLPYLFYP